MVSNLAKVRIFRGYTQAELANRAGVSLRVLQNYEQGANNINGAKLRKLCKIADALGCSVLDILQPEKDNLIENHFKNFEKGLDNLPEKLYNEGVETEQEQQTDDIESWIQYRFRNIK